MENEKHILEEVQQRWGDQHVLVTVDGLELEDCEGAQGKEVLQFCLNYLNVCSFL